MPIKLQQQENLAGAASQRGPRDLAASAEQPPPCLRSAQDEQDAACHLFRRARVRGPERLPEHAAELALSSTGFSTRPSKPKQMPGDWARGASPTIAIKA